jgi:hypothetical protein
VSCRKRGRADQANANFSPVGKFSAREIVLMRACELRKVFTSAGGVIVQATDSKADRYAIGDYLKSLSTT